MIYNLIFISVCLIWGSSFILMKEAALLFGPISMASYRVLLGGGCLALVWAFRRLPLGIERRQWPAFFTVVVLGYIVPFTLQPWIIHKLDNSALIGMVVAFVPLTTGLVSIPMLGVRPTRRELIGILGGLVALVIFNLDGVLRDIPVMYLLLACVIPFSYAVSNTAVKQFFSGIDALPLTCSALLMSGAMMLPFSLTAEPLVIEGGPVGYGLVCLVVLGVLGTGFANYIFYYLIQKWGPLQAGMVTYVIPLVALGWGWLLGEKITALQVVALSFAFAMVWLVRGGQRHAVETECVEPV